MNYVSRASLHVTIALLLASCGGTSPNPSPQIYSASSKPTWLAQYPIDREFYTGVGSAAKNQMGSEAQKRAQDNALADLSSQISVNISSEIVTSLIEKGVIIEEEYMASAQSQTVADLEGHELVDTWEDQNYYFAYYRLSKAKYAAIQARKRQAALELSSDYYQKALESQELNNFSETFGMTIQAFLPLLPYLNEALTIDIDGSPVILSNRLNQMLLELLTEIKLTPSQSQVKGKLGQAIAKELRVSAKTSHSQVIRNLPLSVRFSKGSGSLTESISTGSSGSADIKVFSIGSSDKLQVLEISTDPSSLLSGIDSPILRGIISSTPPPIVRIMIDVSNPTIYLEAIEVFNGEKLAQAQVEPQLKNHLIKEGFHFVKSQSKADWHMSLMATASKGTEFSGMYTVFADVSLSVIDRSTGDEIFKNSVSRVKGIDLNYSNAANKALTNAAAKLNASFIPEIMKRLK